MTICMKVEHKRKYWNIAPNEPKPIEKIEASQSMTSNNNRNVIKQVFKLFEMKNEASSAVAKQENVLIGNKYLLKNLKFLSLWSSISFLPFQREIQAMSDMTKLLVSNQKMKFLNKIFVQEKLIFIAQMREPSTLLYQNLLNYVEIFRGENHGWRLQEAFYLKKGQH